MGGLDAIQDFVSRAARRRRAYRAWDAAWRVALGSVIVGMVLVVVSKLVPIPRPWLIEVAIAAAVAPLVVALWWFSKSLRLVEAARWLDHKAGLQERLATALEISTPATELNHWQQWGVQDAASSASTVDLKKLMPMRFPRTGGYTLGVAVLALALTFVPEYRSPKQLAKIHDKAVVQDVGKNLGLVIRKEQQKRTNAPVEVAKPLENLTALADRMAGAKLTRNEGVTELAKAADTLRKQASDLQKSPALQKLQEAARAKSTENTPSPAGLQQKADALAKALGDKTAKDPQGLEKLQKDLEHLREEAKAAAKAGTPSAETKADLQRQASELAKRAAELGAPAENLEAAAEALASADVERFMKNIDAATQDIGQMAAAARQLAGVKQQLQQAGKDLAEQLKNGQAQEASQTLQKMMDQLAKAGLTSEQQKQLASELSKALSPAEPYGKVAEHLKQALQECKGGQNQSANKSLAAAKEELQKLSEQMDNAQAMAEAMAALNQAQQAMASGQMWGQGNGNRPGNGNGENPGQGKGRGGRGVGTWSKDDPWAVPDRIEDRWDNSGVSRPDMAAKGHSERDSSTPNNLVPTKVNGQFQPGGPMPSITLKGVSIKGASSAQYTEAVTSAQDEARAALSQEQIPKAYRNAVRDYFGDLPKKE